MTPAAARASYRRQLAAHGETIQILRPGSPDSLFPALARVFDLPPAEVGGRVPERLFRAVVLAEDLEGGNFPLPFVALQDRLVLASETLTVLAAGSSTRRVAGVVIAHDLLLTDRQPHALRIERRQVLTGDPVDGLDYGNTREAGPWIEIHSLYGWFVPKPGSETLAAGRLEASFGGTIALPVSPQALDILTSDRFVFMAPPYAGIACQIRSAVPGPAGDVVEFVVEAGVAT